MPISCHFRDCSCICVHRGATPYEVPDVYPLPFKWLTVPITLSACFFLAKCLLCIHLLRFAFIGLLLLIGINLLDKEGSDEDDVRRRQVENERPTLHGDVTETTVTPVSTEQQLSSECSMEVNSQEVKCIEEANDILSVSQSAVGTEHHLGDQYTSVDISSLVDLSSSGVTNLYVISPVDDNGDVMPPVACLSSRDDGDTSNQNCTDNPDMSDDMHTSSNCYTNSTSTNSTSVLRDVQNDMSDDLHTSSDCYTNSTSVLHDVQNDLGASVYSCDRSSSTGNTVDVSSAAEGLENNLSLPLSEPNASEPVQLYSKQKPKNGCKRTYDKTHFCVFCKKQIQSKIARHLLTVHKGNKRVAEILKMEKGSRQRKIALSMLENEGNLQHNVAVLKSAAGKIVVSHRRQYGLRNCKSSDYAPCVKCHKFVLRKAMWQHYRNCVKRNAVCSTSSTSVQASSAASVYTCDKASQVNTSELAGTFSKAVVGLDNNLSQPLGTSTVSQHVQVCTKQKMTSGSKIVYDKGYFCVFCKKQILHNIGRHLLQVHKGDARVAEILKMEKHSRQRKNALGLLANEGNLQHNVAMLKEGADKLVVSRRTPHNHRSSDYTPCAECHKFVLKANLWRHGKTCVKKNAECQNATEQNEKLLEEGKFSKNSSKKFRYAMKESRALLSSMLCGEKEENLQDVLARMRDDDIKRIIQGDVLVRRYACVRAESLGPKDSRKINDIHRVSKCAKALARLVAVCRQEIPDANLYRLLRPEHMNLLVESAKKLLCAYKKPSLILGRTVGHVLLCTAALKIAQCVEAEDYVEAERTRQFKGVFQREWNDRVNDAVESMRSKKGMANIRTEHMQDLHDAAAETTVPSYAGVLSSR